MALGVITLCFILTSISSSALGFCDRQAATAIPSFRDDCKESRAAQRHFTHSSLDDNETTTRSVSLQVMPSSSTFRNNENLIICANCCCDQLCPLFGDCCVDCNETCLNTRPPEGDSLNEVRYQSRQFFSSNYLHEKIQSDIKQNAYTFGAKKSNERLLKVCHCLLLDAAKAKRGLLLFPYGTHQMFFHVIVENPSHHEIQVEMAVQHITVTFQMALNQTINIAKSVPSSSSGNTSQCSVDLNVENFYSTVCGIVDATVLALNNFTEFLQTNEVKIVIVLLPNTNETSGNKTKRCSTGVLTLEYKHLTLETNVSGDFFIRRFFAFYSINGISFTWKLYPVNNATVNLVQAAMCVLQDPEMLLCPIKGAITLSNASYTLHNETMFVLTNGEQYKTNEFDVRINGTAAMCYNPPQDHEKYLHLVTFYSVEQLATFACLLISIVSLLLLLLTYSVLPKLRNASGVIVMSLSASMLMMQGLMLLVLLPRGWLCLTVAWLLHWSQLATFLWNSVLAFDVAFTIRSKSVSHTSNGSRGCVLRCYVMLCWLLPLLVVVCLGVMDHYGIYNVGYATGRQCYIGTCSALLWLMIVPMCATFLFNCACYVCALSTIMHTSKLLWQATTPSQGRPKLADKRRLLVYIRITLIMGLTWAFYFAAAFVPLIELWIVNIVLNSSQGLYFLICFVLKRRVRIMLRDRFSSLRLFKTR